eukprot:RCo051580
MEQLLHRRGLLVIPKPFLRDHKHFKAVKGSQDGPQVGGEGSILAMKFYQRNNQICQTVVAQVKGSSIQGCCSKQRNDVIKKGPRRNDEFVRHLLQKVTMKLQWAHLNVLHEFPHTSTQSVHVGARHNRHNLPHSIASDQVESGRCVSQKELVNLWVFINRDDIGNLTAVRSRRFQGHPIGGSLCSNDIGNAHKARKQIMNTPRHCVRVIPIGRETGQPNNVEHAQDIVQLAGLQETIRGELADGLNPFQGGSLAEERLCVSAVVDSSQFLQMGRHRGNLSPHDLREVGVMGKSNSRQTSGILTLFHGTEIIGLLKRVQFRHVLHIPHMGELCENGLLAPSDQLPQLCKATPEERVTATTGVGFRVRRVKLQLPLKVLEVLGNLRRKILVSHHLTDSQHLNVCSNGLFHNGEVVHAQLLPALHSNGDAIPELRVDG